MEATLLTVGLACVVAAIVGGGLKAFNIELPGVASLGRQVLLGGFGLLLTTLALFGVPSRDDASSEQATRCASEIIFDEEIECPIAKPGDEQTHAFRGEKGDRVRVRVIRVDNISPETQVLRPDGTLECGPGWGDIERCTLDATGTHSLVVKDGHGSKTGSYALRIVQLSDNTSSADGTPRRCASEIAYGGEVECSIARPAEERTHAFPGGQGDRVTVRVIRADNISPETEILRPDGTLECGPGYGDIERCTLDATGTHSVAVKDSHGSKTGSYVLRLERP